MRDIVLVVDRSGNDGLAAVEDVILKYIRISKSIIIS